MQKKNSAADIFNLFALIFNKPNFHFPLSGNWHISMLPTALVKHSLFPSRCRCGEQRCVVGPVQCCSPFMAHARCSSLSLPPPPLPIQSLTPATISSAPPLSIKWPRFSSRSLFPRPQNNRECLTHRSRKKKKNLKNYKNLKNPQNLNKNIYLKYA